MANYLTKTLTVFLYPVCPDKGVYVRWLNNLGGWEGWFFGGKKGRRFETESVATVVSQDGRNESSTAKNGKVYMTLRCGGLTEDQALAKEGLYQSPMVYIQEVSGELTPIEVVPGSFDVMKEGEKSYLCTLEVLLPKTNALVR